MPLAGKRGVPSAAVASRSAGLFGHVLEACPLLGGGGSICGSRQPFCWAVQTCARGQREARGVWVWLIYGWKQARKFDWIRTRVWLVPAGPLVRYFRTNYSSKDFFIKRNPLPRVQLLARPGEPSSQLLQYHTLPKSNSGSRGTN